jgi:serine/threonine-protein kinase
MAVIGLVLLSWLVAGSHVPAIEELPLFFSALSSALFGGCLVWVVYMALEPHVRRRWPHTLITWARVLASRGADPLVGRDVVCGVTAGVLLALGFDLQLLALRAFAPAPPLPRVPRFDALGGLGDAAAALFGMAFDAVFSGLLLFLMLFLLRVALRRTWLAGAALVAIVTAMNVVGSEFPLIDGVFTAGVVAALAWILIRFGLVAFSVAEIVSLTLESLPFTLDGAAWYWWTTLVALGVVGALAVYGFRAALAGQRLFAHDAPP